MLVWHMRILRNSMSYPKAIVNKCKAKRKPRQWALKGTLLATLISRGRNLAFLQFPSLCTQPGCMNDPLLNGCPGTHKLFTGRRGSSKAARCQMWGPEKGDGGEHLVPWGSLGLVPAPALHFLFKLWERGLDTWLNPHANSYSLGLLQTLLSEFLFSKHPSLLKHKHPS